MATYDLLASKVIAPLSIGIVLRDTFRTIARAWLPILAISSFVALASLPFAILYAKKIGPLTQWVQAGAKGQPPSIDYQATFASIGGTYVLQIVAMVYAFGVVSAGVAQTLEGGGFDVGRALKVGLVRGLPMLVAAVAFYVVLGLGLMLLVVPGLIFGAAYGLAPTLCVTERHGPFESFSRSADLTRGNRWRCLAVTLILTFVPGIIVLVVNSLIVRVVGAQNNFIVAAVTNVFALPIYYVYPAVLAYDLRRAEGGGPRNVVEVF